MLYLVTQIVLCLLFTTLVGLTLGWLLRGLGTSRQIDQVDADWRAQIERLQSQREKQAIVDESHSNQSDESLEVAQLRETLADRERQIQTLQAHPAAQNTAPIPDMQTKEKLQQSQAMCQQLQVRLADYSTGNEQLEKQLQHIQSERHAVADRLRDTEGELARLTQERERAIQTIAGLQKDLRTLRGTLAHQEQLQRESPAVAAGSTGAAAIRRSGVTTPTKSPDAAKPVQATASQPPAPAVNDPIKAARSTPRPDSDDGQQNLPIDAAEPDKPPPYQPEWRLKLPAGNKDNLQAIYGVGPKLEERLNHMGIFHFRQIASFDKRDILWVAEHLRSFPGRILRDRWVEQARTLESRRQGESANQD